MSVGKREVQEHVLLHAESAKRRLLARIIVSEGGCWLWQGAVNHGGYGTFPVGPRASYKCVSTHRTAYILFVGTIPDGLQLDHLCRVRSCCNPAHLEPVTPLVNTRRSWAARRTERVA